MRRSAFNIPAPSANSTRANSTDARPPVAELTPSATDHAKADPRIARLPKVPRALAERLGYAAGVQLMEKFGGTILSIPKGGHADAGSTLLNALGAEATRVLIELFGSSNMEIPSGAVLRSAARKQEIISYQGSANEAARAFGVSNKWVRMVRRAARRDAEKATRRVALREAFERDEKRLSQAGTGQRALPSRHHSKGTTT